ncbi:MAG: cytochrome c biogenesis protein CcdA, partial [Rhizobiales bacterium]|nr:cytochrome c biogenesis protein CcdA [Hyphomicrobiales bacterium]
VLPLVPGYISYVAGNTAVDEGSRSLGGRLSTLLLGVFFVLGFSTIFISLGASATAISRILLWYRYEANILGGALIILFGVFMTGLVRLPWLQRDFRFHGDLKGGRPLGAYVLGLAFGFGWTPCIGPVLGAILTVSALSSTASSGIALLGIYSLGLAVPFLLSVFAFLLNFVWEFLQAPFFEAVPNVPHWEGVKLCSIATLGDAAIMLFAFWCVAAAAQTRAWILSPRRRHLAGFAGVGVAITIGLEWSALVTGRWQYSEAMPVIPFLEIGLVPILQWIFVPLVTAWFVRRQLT